MNDHKHKLNWNPYREIWVCEFCPLAFASEFTYPANSPEEVNIILNSIGIDEVGDCVITEEDKE